MYLFTAMLTMMALLTSAPMQAQTLVLTRDGSRLARAAPAENFTGGVRVEMLFEALDPSHASGGSVTFEPGARTAWHSHPRGQILIVTAGTGRVQRWGDPGKDLDLRGQSDTHRFCVKSLIGTALVGFDARQHARTESLSKCDSLCSPSSISASSNAARAQCAPAGASGSHVTSPLSSE
jgi:hypothetical protein